MKEKAIPTPVVAAVLVIVVGLLAFFLYKGATGGTTTNSGAPGQVSTAPPMPNAGAKQEYQQSMSRSQGGH
jgi:hypothetical protein